MIGKRLRALALSLISGLPLLYAVDGSTAYNFLDVTTSSRVYGLGGVNITTIADDIFTIGQNPALLGYEMDNQFGVGYMRYLGDSNFASLYYGREAGEHGAWAASVKYFGYGSIKGTDEMGNFTSDFSPQDVAFSGFYSHDINDCVRGGVALNFLYSGYEQYSAFAIGVDLGINYYDADRDLSMSAVIANLGGQVKRFADHYDRLPFDIRLGWAKSFGSLPIRFNITAWNLTKWNLPYYHNGDDALNDTPRLKDSFGSNLFRHLIFGAEYIPNDRFYVNLGYNYKTRTDMSTYNRNFLSGFSLGAGLNVDKFAVGIALSQPHTGATTFMVNLRLDINQLLN